MSVTSAPSQLVVLSNWKTFLRLSIFLLIVLTVKVGFDIFLYLIEENKLLFPFVFLLF